METLHTINPIHTSGGWLWYYGCEQIGALNDHYKVETAWTGGLYYGIKLDWSCKDRLINISVQG